MRRHVVEGLPVRPIAGADLQRLEPAQHIELRDQDLGEAVQPRRVPSEAGVEPAAPALAACHRAQLLAADTQPFAHLVVELRRERSRAHPCDVGLHDAHHPVDPLGADAGAREGAAGDRVRGGHERVRAVVEVEQHALRALEHHVLAVAQGPVEQRSRVDDLGLDPVGERHVLLHDALGIQRQAVVDLREDQVLLAQDDLELLAEDLLVEQVLDPQADPRGLVAVGGADPALRRAERVLAQESLRHLLELQVVRHDHVRVAADDQPGDIDARLADLIHLLEQMAWIDHDPVGDHRGDVRVEDARGDQLELQQAALGDDGVARVVPALVADHVVHAVGEVVDRLALALVPPLGAEHDRGRHDGASLPVGGASGPACGRSPRPKSPTTCGDSEPGEPPRGLRWTRAHPGARAGRGDLAGRYRLGSVVTTV